MTTEQMSLTPAQAQIELAKQYEKRLLGSLMVNADQIDQCLDIVGFDDFIDPTHAQIWSAIIAIQERRDPVHITSVNEVIAHAAALSGATTNVGLPFLQSLANDASNIGATADARKVRERSALRLLADMGERIAQEARAGTATSDAIMERVSALVTDTTQIVASRGVMQNNFVPINVALEDYVTKLAARAENPDLADGIKFTKLEHLNEYLTSLAPGFHVLAAPPGEGKTAFVLDLAEQAYESTELDARVPVSCLIFSIEMTLPSLMERMVAKFGVDMNHLKTGQINEDEWGCVTRACAELGNREIWFDPTRPLRTSDIASRLRRFVREKKSRNGLVVIDYLQLIELAIDMKVAEKVSYVSSFLAGLAKEFGLIFLVISHLNREREKRANKRPMMTDLKGSSQIEQDADGIYFLYRDPQTPDLTEFIAAKNRLAEANRTVDLGWSGKYQRYYDIDQRTPQEREAPAQPQREQRQATNNWRAGGGRNPR
jgi:replicative DNA helicase